MALEKEIIVRIQDAVDSGNQLQEDLYKELLGSLVYGESRGLVDSPDLLSQPEAAQAQEPQEHERTFTKSANVPTLEPRLLNIAQKANSVCCKLDDGVSIHDVYFSPDWREAEKELADQDRYSLTRAIMCVVRYSMSLGDVRRSSIEDLCELRNVGFKTASLLLNVVQPSAELLNT